MTYEQHSFGNRGIYSNGEIKEKAENTEQVIMNSHRAGLSIDVIAHTTNLTVEQVSAILIGKQ